MERLASLLRTIGWLCVLASATVAAWRFGGVKAIDQLWLLGLLTLAAVCLLLSCWTDEHPLPKLPAALWPLLAGVLLGVVQLVALPSSIHQSVSQRGWEWWSTYSTDSIDSSEDSFTLSMYPASTRHDLAALGLGVGAFLLASSFCQDRRRALWLLSAVMINGAALALFGIVQFLSFNGKLYWTVPLTQGGTPFAAFVNRNHAAGYLNLCFAAAIGVYVYLLVRNRVHHENGNGSIANDWASPKQTGEWQLLTVGAVCALIMAAVVCTTSRGGAVAACAAFVVTILVSEQLRTDKRFRRLLAGVALAGVALAVWLGRAVFLRNRFRELFSDEGLPSNGRLEHWADALTASRDFWLTGTGFGTYRFAYRPYETSFIDGWYYHAENQYVEALLEGGLPGLLLLIAALWLAGQAIRRRRQQQTPISIALGTAGMFGITAQAVHSLFDFGLYMPSNALLFGTLIGCAGWVARPARLPRVRWGVVFLLIACWLGWGITEISKHAKYETWQRAYQQLTPQLPESGDEFLTVLEPSSVAPGFAEAELLAADIDQRKYQLATSEVLAQQSDVADEQLLWELSNVRILHQRAHQLLVAGQADLLATVRDNRQVQQYLGAAHVHLQTARRACPLLPKVHLGLAQLGVIFGAEEYEPSRLQRAVDLSPFVPDVLFQAGLLDLQAGRVASGFQRWNRCLLLSPKYIDQVMQLASSVTSMSELFDRVLPQSAERLVQIADRYFASDEAVDNRVRLAELASAALESDPSLSSAQRLLLEGHVHRLKGETAAAIRQLTSAVALSPSDVAARYELAKLLMESDHLMEAQHHATICHRLDPSPRKYTVLLNQIRDRLVEQTQR